MVRIRAFVFILAAAGMAPAQTIENDPPVFRTSVSLVSVDAKVTGRDGRDITKLTADDFVIYDENDRRGLTNFGSESTPIDVLMVLDVGPEMRPFLLELTPRVMDALTPLRSADRAGAMLFGARNELIAPLTTDLIEVPRKVVNSIYKDRYGRGVLLNEALVEAAKYLKEQPVKARRTLIVVTNNRGVRAAVRDADVVRAVLGADAVLNAILVGEDSGPRTVLSFHDPKSVQPDVFRYAKETGGDVVTGEQPARALKRIIEEATTRYHLQFAAPADASGFRSLRVELSPAAQARYPGARIQARSGYEVPK